MLFLPMPPLLLPEALAIEKNPEATRLHLLHSLKNSNVLVVTLKNLLTLVEGEHVNGPMMGFDMFDMLVWHR